MGAAASTESEKEDLRKVYAVFSSLGGSDKVSSKAFSDITKEHAPKLWQRLHDTGDGPSALIALQEQLEGARIKLNSPTNELLAMEKNNEQMISSSETLNYDWATDAKTNLRLGLAGGMLTSVPLPKVRFVIGEGKRACPSSSEGASVTLDIPTGSRATVVHIKAQPDMNGQTVTVLGKDSIKERYKVKFVNSEKLALLKRENLVPVIQSLSSSSSSSPGHVITALVDTGAERSALSPTVAHRAGLSSLIDSSFAGQIGGIGSTNGHGRVHFAKLYFPIESIAQVPTLSTKIASHNKTENEEYQIFESGFDVFEWPSSAIDFDAILGVDFLSRYQGQIKFGTQNRELILTVKPNHQIIVPLVT